MGLLRDATGHLTAHAVDQSQSAATPAASFVITLCVLAAPLAIPQPHAPNLKRFRFFVSRGVIKGRDVRLLTMGFFATQEEAEGWLKVLRGTYPRAVVSRLPTQPQALSATETLKVLEVRAPKPAVSPSATATRALEGKPAQREASPARSRSLEETLDDLASSEFELESADSGNTTGVRHLRMEVQRRPRRVVKP